MIERESTDGIELLRLSHGKANALDLELCTEIESALHVVAGSEATAVVLTGKGSIFSAGVDLFRLLDEGKSYVERFLPALETMLRTVFEFPKPLVCAINGHAIAGGCLLAISGDVRVMAEGKGRIGVPELLVGVPFPPYALEMLRLTLHGRSLDQFVYSGVTELPAEALEGGLIDRVVPLEDLERVATGEAERLSAIDPEIFRMTKAQLRGRAADSVRSLSEDLEPRTMNIWSSETAHGRIRDYLDRTVGK